MLDETSAPTTHAILGAAIEVHRVLGPGFMEAVYQDCLEIEFRRRGIVSTREAMLQVTYKGEVIPSTYKADFLVEGVVVELKAKHGTPQSDEAQVVNYLRASGVQVGLLLNFGGPRLTTRRFVHGFQRSLSASAATSA
ncbi:MAG TPA: GxxExxY protein [Candidatus Thermoplasmatota archaeon]|nr:GxxExxY protein [Candidatus Thermoplasmatota archaeon]